MGHPPTMQEAVLGFVSRSLLTLALGVTLAAAAAAQSNTTKVTLDTSEPLFSVLAALNACGYDAELSMSDPLRNRMREAVKRATAAPEAARARDQICVFYRDKQLSDAAQNYAQYISLALNLGPAPDFKPALAEADLPPDALNVLGFVPLLQTFYASANLQGLWQQFKPEMDGLITRHSRPVANLLFQTDLYLKIPLSGAQGRRMIVYLDPQGAPGQVNARNYGTDYHVVVSPTASGLPLEQLRHTYLHYVLDPLTRKNPGSLRRVEPLLEAVQRSPMDRSYKQDAGLLLTESLIRAIEARQSASGKSEEAEAARKRVAEASVNEGFVLTSYFFDELRKFEAEPTGLHHALADMLYGIDVGREKKRAQEVTFVRASSPDVVRGASKRVVQGLDLAEERLAAGDAAAARQMALAALDEKDADQARALFLLGRASTLLGDLKAARLYFERTLNVAREPRTVAWSHIFLARILDLGAQFQDGTLDQEVRQAALQHYRAALAAGDATPDTKLAAERGLQAPYTPARR